MMISITEKNMQSGCYRDLTNEEYHSDKSRISRSALMDFDRSPYNYWAKHINPERPLKDATSSMILGSAFHTLILEPNLFDKNYIMKPEAVLLKEVGREAYDAYKNKVNQIEFSGQIVLSHDDWNNLMSMKKKLELSERAMKLIQDSRIENSFFWKDEGSELLVKARPDILHSNIIVDLKTCSDASPRAYQLEMIKYGYHVQGAMVRDGVEICEGNRINKVINICVETKYPYNLAIYIIDETALDHAENQYKNMLINLKIAIDNNDFRDFGVQTIELPKWAI